MTATLTGTNWFGVKTRLDELVNTFIKDYGDLAVEKLNGQESSYGQILGAIESLPFLADKKMVIIHDLSQNKQAAESIEQLFARLPESTDIIIVEPKLDKRSGYYKTLRKLTDYQEFNELEEYRLADWLVDRASKNGAKLTRRNALYMIERVGNNQTRLAQELTKISSYNPQITRSSIDLLVDEDPSSTIFNLIDSVFSGNINSALRLYQEQRSQRVEPQAIHAMLVWQMHSVALISLAPKVDSAQTIAAASGMNPYVVQKSQRIAQKMGQAKISKFMSLLRDIDYKSKRETIDYDEALRFAIVSLAEE